jgi:hypothetical protein
VTSDQILLEVGLIVTLTVGSQVLAGWLRVPALIILLPAGFIADKASPIIPSMSKIAPMAPSDPVSTARPCTVSQVFSASSVRVVASGAIR